MSKRILIWSLVFTILFYTAIANDSRAEKFKKLFGVECLDESITDNYGKGFDDAYGTRNMKPVLHGIVYRGGANNYYHKNNKRENRNPLPPDGLKHLAGLGFSSAFYLYKTNFETAETSISSGGNTLTYKQNSANTDARVKELVKYVYELINDQTQGPTYLHCWNGWHQSGYISSVLLMQYCNYSNQKALKYWTANAGGNHKGYEHIKKAIREFKPYKEFEISEKKREDICPCYSKRNSR